MKKISILCVSLFLGTNVLVANKISTNASLMIVEGQSSLTIKASTEKIAGLKVSAYESEKMDVLMINVDSEVTRVVEAVLYSESGKEINKSTIIGEKGSKTGKMDLGSLPKGNYKLRITDKSSKLQSTYSVVKSK